MGDKEALKDLRRIPGIGKSLGGDLLGLGYRSVAELKGQDPQEMYERFMEQVGAHVDRCVLYVLRCAVYFAETEGGARDPEKLKWWNWKDGK